LLYSVANTTYDIVLCFPLNKPFHHITKQHFLKWDQTKRPNTVPKTPVV